MPADTWYVSKDKVLSSEILSSASGLYLSLFLKATLVLQPIYLFHWSFLKSLFCLYCLAPFLCREITVKLILLVTWIFLKPIQRPAWYGIVLEVLSSLGSLKRDCHLACCLRINFLFIRLHIYLCSSQEFCVPPPALRSCFYQWQLLLQRTSARLFGQSLSLPRGPDLSVQYGCNFCISLCWQTSEVMKWSGPSSFSHLSKGCASDFVFFRVSFAVDPRRLPTCLRSSGVGLVVGFYGN